MLIRRFSQHIKDQNWFAVVLDFFVIVIGIFIGLQVTDWNQQRLDRQKAAYHLTFLYDEIAAEIVAAEAEIEQSRAKLRNSFQASMLLTKDEWSEGDKDLFDKAIFSTFELWGPKRRPVSLRRMTDDGKLNLIERDF